MHQLGVWTLSMISYRSVKMTSNYPTSCLEVRRKQKVNKLIFKGCSLKNICKYQHFNHIVFSCSTCLQKENYLSGNNAIIVRYAVYKAWSLHKGQLTDMLSGTKITGQLGKNSSGHATRIFAKKSRKFEILLLGSNVFAKLYLCVAYVY